ncbi:hypothetical protein TWF718_009302 [Orbilia javanica]|uniref:Uncharacterized protein n=1 Tax=Orbilia javanica TaxID=47235 RepID=A0AAN8MLZ2_9PEZI
MVSYNLRLRQQVSISESLSGVHSTRSTRSKRSSNSQPPLSKRPSLANSASSSRAGSQRNSLREHRAEALLQSTPYSTIRLIISRASEAPDAVAAPHLFRQVMEYFGADGDIVKSVIAGQQQQSDTSAALGIGDTSEVTTGMTQQENNNPITSGATLGTGSPSYSSLFPTASGTSTPGSEQTGDISACPFSNSEILMYINIMLGSFPPRRRTTGGVADLQKLFDPGFNDPLEDGSEYGYVSDCEPCDIDSLDGDDEVRLKVSGAMRDIKEDNDYDCSTSEPSYKQDLPFSGFEGCQNIETPSNSEH